MPDVTTVLTALRQELVNAGIVRKASVAGPLRPCWVEPDGGLPEPGAEGAIPPETDPRVTVGLRLSTTFGETTFDVAWRRRYVIDVLTRSRGVDGLQLARGIQGAIAEHIAGPAGYAYGITLAPGSAAPVFVLEAQLFAGLGPIGDAGKVRTELSKLMLEVSP